MFVKAYWQCDREGCTTKISEEEHHGSPCSPGTPIWYSLTTIFRDGGYQSLDFCSLDCLEKQLITNAGAAFVIRRDTK